MTPAPTPDLARRAAALAAQQGWEVLATTLHDDAELRQVVLRAGAAFPVELSLRASGPEARSRVQTEMEVAAGERSEHLVGFVEVVPEPTRRRELRGAERTPAVLLEHASGGLLADLLPRRVYLRAGEVATVLLGVAAGLSALNARGWAHGALTSRCVVFRHDSCPALTSLSGARRLTPETRAADIRGFLRLAERLATSLPRSEGDRMLEALREPLRSGDWDAVADAVGVAAEPEAVFIPVGLSDLPADAPSVRGTESSETRSGAGGSGVLVAVLEGHPVASLVQRATAWLGTRKRLVAIALAPLAIVAAALALMPPGPANSEPSEPGPAPSREATSAGSPSASETRSASPSAPTTAARGHGDERIRGDDPVIAAEALLEARFDCFAQATADAGCLDSSVRADSALYRDDAAALGVSGAGAARDFSGAELALVQRWGDAALVSATRAGEPGAKSEPASLLLMRSEAGWRLRDVYLD